MYKTQSRRRQLIVRTGIYSLMTIAVVLLVTFLVFVMLGFRFNKDTSTIEQGGLVQFASRPDNANVTIGKAKLTDLTPAKITVNPGNYDVKINRSGYQDWKKNVDVRAGEVLWLNYAQLVPNKVDTKKLTRFDALLSVKSSPNGDRFAAVTDPTKPVVSFIDVSSDTPKLTTLTIPTSALPTDTSYTMTVADWANDSDRLLVNVTYGETTDRLLVDRRDSDKTINLTKSYEADIAEAVFDPRSSERLIIRTSKNDVRTINTSNDSLSSVIATSVTSMSLYGNDALLVVQSDGTDKQTVGYISLGSDKLRILKRVASAERTLAAIESYFSEPYLAVATGSKLDVYRLQNLPSSSSDASISMTSVVSSTLPSQANYLSIRSSGRFVVTQYDGGVQTNDIEINKQSIVSFNAPVTTELRWLDKYHYYVTNGTNLEVMEFDGGNPRTITGLTTGFDAVQTDDGKFIYTLNALDGKFVVQQSRMILEQ